MNWSLIKGHSRFLMQLFLMRAGVDDGDVFDVEDFDINPFDDIETLYFKNTIVVRRMMLRSVPKLLRGELRPWKQSGKPSYLKKGRQMTGVLIGKKWMSSRSMTLCERRRARTRVHLVSSLGSCYGFGAFVLLIPALPIRNVTTAV
jgi:methionyl-tRNA formyltransferase